MWANEGWTARHQKIRGEEVRRCKYVGNEKELDSMGLGIFGGTTARSVSRGPEASSFSSKSIHSEYNIG